MVVVVGGGGGGVNGSLTVRCWFVNGPSVSLMVR